MEDRTSGDYDVVVLGSGAAGFAAAVTAAEKGLSVALLEKSDQVGGTSAWSGGHVWIPANPPAARLGIEDSVEEGIEYLLSLSRDRMDESLVRAFVEAGPKMVDYLDRVADTRFTVSEGIPDYHPENPGGKTGGGRTLECPLYPFDELGEWSTRVTPSPYYRIPHITMSETPTGKAVPSVPSDEEIARRRIRDERGLGQSLIGRLLAAALRFGVEVRTSQRARHLVKDGDRVSGVVVETEGGETVYRARRGVVIATGGFEWNDEYRRAFLRGPLELPVSIETNEGDGLYMAMEIGAALGMMSEAFWTTVAEIPGINSRHRMMLSADRTRPRAIMVNQKGRRFANESANYNAFGGALHQEDVTRFEYANLPAWLVFDHEYLRTYGTVGHAPSDTPPAWLQSAPSVDALADLIGAPHEALAETLDRWNAQVDAGHDTDFARGESAHDRWWGDPNAKGRIEGSLGRLDTPPYYAIRVRIGALGTKGGPRIDGSARVLDLDGDPIPGLYAAGNAASAPYGMTYGGAGGTLGPALTGGYLAGLHLAGAGE